MRRTTLGSMSPAQVNARVGQVNASQRFAAGKQPPRFSLGASKQQGLFSNRRSSSYNNKPSQPRADPRPITDRAFQQDCIRTVASYSSNHGFAMSPKLLMAPSSKDVFGLVQFLFRQIDPNVTFVGKMEEEVPILFKKMGYPVQISKSALYAAGTPHTWPALLAALTWLVDLLSATEKADFGQDVTPFDDAKLERLNDYINKGYILFLDGDDTEYGSLQEQYLEQVKEERHQDEIVIGELRETEAQLSEQLRLLKTELSPLAALEAKKNDYLGDIGKLNMVVTNFQSHIQSLEKKLDEKRQELTSKKAEVDSVSTEIVELREKIAGQEVNAADVEKMIKENQIVDVNLEAVLARKQDQEKAAWDHEVQSSKKLRDVEAVTAHYNDALQRLIPIASEDMKEIVDFDIKLNPRADTPEEILGGKVKSVLKPAFAEIVESLKRSINNEALEASTLRQELFANDVSLREKRDEISRVMSHNKKLEGQCKSTAAKLEGRIAATDAVMEEFETNMAKEEPDMKLRLDTIEQQQKTLQANFEEAVKRCNSEMELHKNDGTQILEIILSTKERAVLISKKLKDATSQSFEVFHNIVKSP